MMERNRSVMGRPRAAIVIALALLAALALPAQAQIERVVADAKGIT